MHATDFKPAWQRGWVIGLALLSLIVPMAAVFLRSEPAVPFGHPDHLSYYRQTVAALFLGIVFAAGAIFANRRLTPAGFRRLGIGLASLGVLISAYLLFGLIGSCGPQVIWGVCTP